MTSSRRMFKRTCRTVVLLILIASCLVVATPSVASAHPLGNFTVNRYAKIEPSAGVLRITYVLDMAEIPTFQIQKQIDANRDQYAIKTADEIASNLRLTIDGRQQQLQRKDFLLTEPEGQGGLPTSRLSVIYEVTVDNATQLSDATFADNNQPDRIGWREIIVHAAGNSTVTGSNAPTVDVSNELTNYPANLIQAPLDLRAASFKFDTGTIAVPAQQLVSPTQAIKRADGGFAGLINKKNLGPLAIVGLFALALVFGAGHALAPGHGKSVMAAYLVGTRGRPIDAVLLGVIVSVMHTGSVLVVGFVLLQLGSHADVASIYPVLTIAGGLVALGLGLGLFVTRYKAFRKSRVHAGHTHENHEMHIHLDDESHTHENSAAVHSHDHEKVAQLAVADTRAHEQHHVHSHTEHTHTHDDGTTHSHHEHDHHADKTQIVHDHGFGSHSHELPTGVAPLSRKGLVLLATSGGLLPSPSAVIVLIAAVSLGRLGLGLGLIATFSVGLAVTLTAVGLSLVWGRKVLERRSRGGLIIRLLPAASACGLIAAGTVAIVRGLTQL